MSYAAILSLSREGKRVPGKLGAITFQMGDTLLLEASKEFAEQYRFRRDPMCQRSCRLIISEDNHAPLLTDRNVRKPFSKRWHHPRA